MSRIDTCDQETEELEFLANNTPSKFAIMTIDDEDNNVHIRVDQSLDSSFGTHSDGAISFIKKVFSILQHFKNKKYDGYLDNEHELFICGIRINFGTVTGEKAHRWMIRYFRALVNTMEESGLIKKEESHGK
ncbi:MAG: hypothetical protein WC175_05655 [Candidatus Dojkabacteria bacterium]